jgi:hypothetical protein
MSEHWIQKALAQHKPGALHKNLHIPLGHSIDLHTLGRAAKEPGVVGKRARLAMTLRGFKR